MINGIGAKAISKNYISSQLALKISIAFVASSLRFMTEFQMKLTLWYASRITKISQLLRCVNNSFTCVGIKDNK